jgi:hypothetical protein
MLKLSNNYGVSKLFLILINPTMNDLKEVLASNDVGDLFLIIEGGVNIITNNLQNN